MKKLSLYLILFLFFCNVGKTESSLPECQGDDQKQWINCQGIQIFGDERKYTGEFKDGKRHGQGTLINPDGSKYIGQWKDGLPNGKGSEMWEDGTKYVG